MRPLLKLVGCHGVGNSGAKQQKKIVQDENGSEGQNHVVLFAVRTKKSVSMLVCSSLSMQVRKYD